MKVLSLTQPFASLMAFGEKTIETRAWGTSYRGDVAIHAAKGCAPPFERLFVTPPHSTALERHGVGRPPRGTLLCVVEIYDVVSTIEARLLLEQRKLGDGGWQIPTHSDRLFATGAKLSVGSHERDFGNYDLGRFAWLTRNLRILDGTVAHRGTQGLRDLPPDLERAVRKDLNTSPSRADR